MTLAIPEDLHKLMKKHNMIKWSEVARQAIWSKAKKIELMDKLADGSKLTKEDIDNLDHKIKSGLLKRFSK